MDKDHIINEIKELRKDMVERFEKTSDKIHNVSSVLSVQKEQLKEHMRRSDALEIGQKLLKKEFENRYDKLEGVISPIQDHIKFVSNGLRWAGLIAGTITFALGVIITLKQLGVF